MDLLYLNTLQNLTLLPSSYISQCIEQLNALYNIELNVYILFGNQSAIEMLLPAGRADLPSFRISNAAVQLVLVGNYTERALTVVYLEHAQASRVFDYITTWLWRVQQLQLLIIYPEATAGNMLQLFSYCWRQGMVHVLVLLPHTRQLYSYMPYPTLSLLAMEGTLQYFHRTRGMLWNFHRFQINCGILPSAAPRAFLFQNAQHRVVYAGYMLRMVLDFVDHFNGSIRTHTLDTLRVAIDALNSRTIDFLPYVLAQKSNFTASVVLWNENSFLIAPSGRLLPRYMYLLKAYTWTTWLSCLALLAYCSTALFLLSQGHLNFSAALLQILRLTLFLPAGRDLVTPPAPRRLLLFIIMIIAGWILTNLYLAQLSSNLAAGLYDKQLQSFDDLAGTDYKLPQNELDYNFLLQLPDLHEQLAKRLVLTPEHLVDSYRNNLNTSMLHNGLADSIEFALYQQKFLRVPLFHKLSQVIYQQPFFMPVAYGRPYLKIFNFYVRRMFEAGILLKMKNEGFAHGIQSGRLHFANRARYQEVNSIDVEYYYLAMGVWLGGMLSASFCFLCECWLGSRAKEPKTIVQI